MIHVIYCHNKSPKKYLPDEIAVGPNKLRRLPNTETNPAVVSFRADGKLLKDGIGLSDRSKCLIIHEYVPGILAISQNGSIIGEVKI